MDPETLNNILFLKANKEMWREKCIIDQIINDFDNADNLSTTPMEV